MQRRRESRRHVERRHERQRASGSASGAGGTSGGSSGTSGTSGDHAEAVEEVSGDIAAVEDAARDEGLPPQGPRSRQGRRDAHDREGHDHQGRQRERRPSSSSSPARKIIAEGTADEPIVFTSQAAEGVTTRRRLGRHRHPRQRAGELSRAARATSRASSRPVSGHAVRRHRSGRQQRRAPVRPHRVRGRRPQRRTTRSTASRSPASAAAPRSTTSRSARRSTTASSSSAAPSTRSTSSASTTRTTASTSTTATRGRLQFLVLQQDPNHAGDDNGFESDNDAHGSANLPLTSPTVYNATLCGKNAGRRRRAVRPPRPQEHARHATTTSSSTASRRALDIRDASTALAVIEPASSASRARRQGRDLRRGEGHRRRCDNIALRRDAAQAAPDKDNDTTFDEVAWVQGTQRATHVRRTRQASTASTPTAPAVRTDGLAHGRAQRRRRTTASST